MNNLLTTWLRDTAAFGMLVGVGGFLLAAWGVITVLTSARKVSPEMGKELHARCASWLVIYLLLAGILTAGRLAVIAGVCILSILCYREFARATGFFRNRALSGVVVAGIILVNLAAADNWYGFIVAIPSLVITLLLIVALCGQSPEGFIQRVGLAVLSFMLFGVCLGYMAYFANDAWHRSILLLILISVELNDVFAFCVGKWIGGVKLAPRLSPGKTLAGSLGALVLTTAMFTVLGFMVFRGTGLDRWQHLPMMGFILSFTGQMGDLIISGVKRDLGVKDMGTIIPGHGGLLDRFDSLLFVGPALFHYVQYFCGLGLDQPVRSWF